MKKFFPLFLVALSFSGFLSLQLFWDVFGLKAQQINQDKSRDQLFERLYAESKLTSLDKKTIELKAIKSPIVVVNFWASWCVPCLKEFPSLVEFKKTYGDKVTVVGINGDEEEPEKHLEKIQKSQKLDFIHVLDPKSEISDKFLVTAYPFSLVYAHGKVIQKSNKGFDFMNKDFISLVDDKLKSP